MQSRQFDDRVVNPLPYAVVAHLMKVFSSNFVYPSRLDLSVAKECTLLWSDGHEDVRQFYFLCIPSPQAHNKICNRHDGPPAPRMLCWKAQSCHELPAPELKRNTNTHPKRRCHFLFDFQHFTRSTLQFSRLEKHLVHSVCWQCCFSHEECSGHCPCTFAVLHEQKTDPASFALADCLVIPCNYVPNMRV